MSRKQAVVFLFLTILLISCQDKKSDATGFLSIDFSFSVDEEPFETGKFYTNAAGNDYKVEEIKFFISEVIITRENGEKIYISDENSVHYVDHDYPDTRIWKIKDPLPEGEYSTFEFTFGIGPAQNKSRYFLNPPESNMAWPDLLGGGYHYLQINGKWLDNEELIPFCFHTGIGQYYKEKELLSFVHNNFTVSLPSSSLRILENKTTRISLSMNINNWFTNPNNYDFSQYGEGIMSNQQAQEIIRQNGHDVFSIK